MRCVPMIPQLMRSNVLARPVIPTPALVQQLSAKVLIKIETIMFYFDPLILDSCEVNNGGCDPNALCSHDSTSNAVICTCKTGYTNTGTGSNVVCTGNNTLNLR